MRGFYMMRAITVVLLMLMLLSSMGHVHAWSFSNVASSIEKLFKGQDEQESQTVSSSGNSGTPAVNGANDQDVTVQGRIIMVPRRSMGHCQPGQQLDRRGKCRAVW